MGRLAPDHILLTQRDPGIARVSVTRSPLARQVSAEFRRFRHERDREAR